MLQQQSIICTALIVVVLSGLGCTSRVERDAVYDPATDASLQKIMKAFEMPPSQAVQEKGIRGLRHLEIRTGADAPLVDLVLEEALLGQVLRELLHAANVSFTFSEAELRMRISTELNGVPLDMALKRLLEPFGFVAEEIEGVLVVSARPWGAEAFGVEVQLEHLSTTDAVVLLTTLFKRGNVSWGVRPGMSAAYLYGPEAEVREAERILRRADRKLETIQLEVLVVEYDHDSFVRLGADVAGFALDQISEGAAFIGSLVDPTFAFTHTLADNNPQAFRAVIDLLAADNMARVIARPYLTATSGTLAKVQIASDRYVTVQQASSNLSSFGVVTTKPVSAGVMVSITPTALPDGRVRLVIDVQDSEFVPTAGNVAVEVDRSAAQATIEVEAGSTAIIAGLVREELAATNSGLPGLRNVPGVNFLTSKQTRTTFRTEVAIYVTPRLVEPGPVPIQTVPEALGLHTPWKQELIEQ